MFTHDAAVLSCKLPYMEAKQLQQSQQLVRRDLADKGLQLHDALQVVATRKAELRSLVARAVQLGLTEVEIGKLAGISRPTVRDWLGKT
jgi:DNA-directed RNA polymerase specialized sigma24 family protein